jgi:hypothetical protein
MSLRSAGGSTEPPSQSTSSSSLSAHLVSGSCISPIECKRSHDPRKHARILLCSDVPKTYGSLSQLSAASYNEYFLLGSRTVERALRNNLGSRDALGLEIGDLIALSETTSPQCLTLGVLFNHHLAICFCDFLLDYCLVYRALLLRIFHFLHSKYIQGVQN